MTKHKTLKDRVRERQQKTGERYTTALAHVKAHAQERLLGAEEPFDACEAARTVGLACQVSASARLAVGPAGERGRRLTRALERLKGLLLALAGDAGAEKLAAVLLRGEAWSSGPVSAVAELAEARRFLDEVKAGKRGVSRTGRVAVVDVDSPGGGWTLVAVLFAHPFDPRPRPTLYLSSLTEDDGVGPWREGFTLAGLGGWGGA